MIETFAKPFDIALALHACGSATDYAMERAHDCGAAFVVNPCCIGKLQASVAKDDGITHPRSEWLKR